MSEIGISTACYYPLETERSLIKVGELGIKKAEMFINASCELDEPYISEFKRIQNEYSIDIVSLHMTSSFAEGYNYFSEYKRRFEGSLYEFRKNIELANALNSKFLVMHGLKKNTGVSNEEYAERFAVLVETAKQNGVRLLLENVVNFRAESPSFMEYFKKEVGDDFRMVLDIKQCRRAGFDASEFIKEHHDIIEHIHLSDYNDYKDCIPPAEGKFDFLKLFNTMNKYNYRGDYIIEVYSHSYKNEEQLIASYKALSEIIKKAD